MKFGSLQGEIDNIEQYKNIQDFRLNRTQTAFLQGCVAALMTKTGKVGFIGGAVDGGINEILAGYQQGIAYVNNGTQDVVAYCNSFTDPTIGKDYALQMILDGPQRKGDLRRSRAGAINIVPNSTGAAKAIGLVIPELNGKLIGAAQRVPTPTGSTTILNAIVKGTVSVDAINAQMKKEATESFGYNEDQIVSSDVIGMRFGSLFDATQTMAINLDNGTTQVQVVSWYDNENSYVSQMVRTIKHFSNLL